MSSKDFHKRLSKLEATTRMPDAPVIEPLNPNATDEEAMNWYLKIIRQPCAPLKSNLKPSTCTEEEAEAAYRRIIRGCDEVTYGQ